MVVIDFVVEFVDLSFEGFDVFIFVLVVVCVGVVVLSFYKYIGLFVELCWVVVFVVMFELVWWSLVVMIGVVGEEVLRVLGCELCVFV